MVKWSLECLVLKLYLMIRLSHRDGLCYPSRITSGSEIQDYHHWITMFDMGLYVKKKKSLLRPLSFEIKLDWLIDWLIGVKCQLLHYFSYIMVFKLGWKCAISRLLMVFFELLIQSSLVLGVTPADGRLVVPKAVEKGLLYSIKL